VLEKHGLSERESTLVRHGNRSMRVPFRSRDRSRQCPPGSAADDGDRRAPRAVPDEKSGRDLRAAGGPAVVPAAR
jgi:hypothetical protein